MYYNNSWKYIDNVRDDIAELSKDELNLIVMGQLLVNINIGEVSTDFRNVPKEQNKPSSNFSHHGVKVQWNNQNRINKRFVLLDLPINVSFQSWDRKVSPNTIRDSYIKNGKQTCFANKQDTIIAILLLT